MPQYSYSKYPKERAKICFILLVRTFVVPVHTYINGQAPTWSRHNKTSLWSFGCAFGANKMTSTGQSAPDKTNRLQDY